MHRSLANQHHRPVNWGPCFKAPSLWSSGEDSHGLLHEQDRAVLAAIASIGRYKKGEWIYQEGTRADYIFNIISGVAKSFRTQPHHKQQVVGFLFPHDLVGLPEHGKYVNSATALTQVTLYKLPTAALETRLRRNPQLDFQLICKLCHELREGQQHALLLSKHRAVAKIGLFLQLLETRQNGDGHISDEIRVPMARTDIGAYVNVSPEAVTRSLHELVRRGVISVRDRRYITINDPGRLQDIISDSA